jgi:hypothetical protein
MKQPATKLAYGVAILVLSSLLAVPLRAQEASNVLSGVVILNPYEAVVPGVKISLQNEIPVSVEMTWQRQK